MQTADGVICRTGTEWMKHDPERTKRSGPCLKTVKATPAAPDISTQKKEQIMEPADRSLRVGACQFPVSGSMEQNYRYINSAVSAAAKSGVQLLIFPECAVTGYPPVSIPGPDVDFTGAEAIRDLLQRRAAESGMSFVIGSIARDGDARYDRAWFIAPGKTAQWYDKRALGGWDSQNFTEGTKDGIFTLGGFTIAVRICFEVRFPELFREAYRKDADLCIVLFYDTLSHDDPEYCEVIRSHLRSRAAENVFPVLSVNATAPVQAAPTAFVSGDGRILRELPRNKEGLLVWDLTGREISESGKRRKVWIDRFVNGAGR
ncbi:MAG: hypothetical protein CW338_04995 [Clostridiales bacterium]|nr:hypothetical protein [Clostridiales bacterium]